MRLPVIFAPEAEEDLEEIELYLAERFSPEAAQKYILRMITACAAIGYAPSIGTRREEIRPGVRSTGFERRATILFEVRPDCVAILQVLYLGRLPR